MEPVKPFLLNLEDPNQEIEITQSGDYLGVFFGQGDSEKKLKFKFIHTRPQIKSRVQVKAVLMDQSQLDIEALLVINKGAYLTDTYLKIDCLVVGDHSKARAVPGLEILEDEVKAGHGATVGRIDPEQIHYLMTRGLEKQQAEKLVIEAFLAF